MYNLYKLTYPIKLGTSICTVQRYCENMIYCEAIQYFGSFHFIHSQVDVLYSALLRLRLIYCLVQYIASIANFYLSAKRKSILPLYYRTSRILTSLENTP